MSNKTQLQTNNASLDGYIARINAAKDVAAGLPDAGSGGASVETCTVTIEYADADFGGIGAIPESVIYGSILDDNGNIQTVTLQGGIDFEFTSSGIWGGISGFITINNIVKNSILTIIDRAAVSNEYIQHNFELIPVGDIYVRIFFIKQDGSIRIS